MTFRFDPEKHEYFLGDRRLESVTEILERSGIADYRFSNEEAMERGTFVHRATEFIDAGSLDWELLDPVLLPFCEAYMKFIEDMKPEIIMSETPTFHPAYMYGGTFDRFVILNGCKAILDIKSGSPIPATDIQLSAYRELVPGARKSFSLHLGGNGSYRLAESLNHRKNFNVFLAALSVIRWKKEAGI